MRKIIIYTLFVIVVLAIWYGESCKFFCLTNGKCITVWKTFNDKCYIIPSKYFGLLPPARGRILTSNTNAVSIFFVESLSSCIIYQSDDTVEAKASLTNDIIFFDYYSDEKRFSKLVY